MNKKYETAELTIIEFSENDIILTSTTGEEHMLASNDAMEEE